MTVSLARMAQGARSTRGIVFCDVVASTALRQHVGDSRADEWFAGLFAAVAAAVTAADGVVVKWLGDGAMAVFTSAGAALDAAVAIQQSAHSYGRRLRDSPRPHLRVGVSIGDVAGTGDDWHGMPVVQAARLCDAAASDEILATDVVRMLAGSRCPHVMAPAVEYELKGIDERVAVVRVEWAPDAIRDGAGLPPALETARRGPFVGRDLIVADLDDSRKRREWRALLVGGEPGIGKTRLVAELAHRLDEAGWAILLGRCDEDFAVSYRPWIEALGPLVATIDDDRLATLRAEHCGVLGRLLPQLAGRVDEPTADVAVDPDARHAMISDAIASLLRIAGPTIVVLDDVHWIDLRSLQIMRSIIAADLADTAIVATCRDTDIDRFHPLTAVLADLRRVDGVRRLTLDGLDGNAVLEFLEQSAGRAAGAEGVAWAQAVHTRTLGNPLYVGELFRHLADSGAMSSTDGSWLTEPDQEQLPLGLQEVIGYRLTRLGDETIRLLEVAAALGPTFEIDVVDEVMRRVPNPSGEDPIALLETAQAAGIVTDVGLAYQFRHAVIRDVLLGDVSVARRRRLHREIADVLERRWALSVDRHLDEIAYHHGEGRTPQAASWYLRASRAAAEVLDVAALALADRGLELFAVAEPPDLVLRCDLLIARAVGARLTGVETIDDSRLALDAARAVGDQARIAAALLSISLRSMADSHDEHLAFLTDGLRDLTDDTLVARWNVDLALLLREFFDPESDPAEHRARVDHVVAHLDPTDTLSCQIAMRCARSLTSTNQPRDALPIVEAFAANCEGIDTEGFPVEVALSTMWLHLGDRDSSDRLLDKAARDARRSYWFYDCQVLQREVMRSLLDGHWSDAADGAAEVSRIGGHDPNLALGSESQLVWLRRETGEIDVNLQVLNDYLLALPDFPAVRATYLGELAESGRGDDVRSMLDELAPNKFRAVGRGWLNLFSITNVAWAAIATDASDHASTLRPMFDDYAGQIGVVATGTYVMGAVDRVRAGLAALEGDHGEADRLFAAALTQERALRSRPLEARTLHWWGRALLRRGDTVRGFELLRDARALANELAMRGVTRQIDDLSAEFIAPAP